jgi:hypothetical protein
MFTLDSVKKAEEESVNAWNESGPPMQMQTHSATVNI